MVVVGRGRVELIVGVGVSLVVGNGNGQISDDETEQETSGIGGLQEEMDAIDKAIDDIGDDL